MTKEELKQEAKVYSYKLYHSKAWNPGEDMLVKAYLAGAETREKRIAELNEKNKQLTDQLCNVANNLLDSWCRNKDDYCPHLAKLEAQIEKMKCCFNCKHSRTEYEHCKTDKHEKWEIKEK